MTEPIQITVTLDLDKWLRGATHYDSEGEPLTEPTTVEQIIIDTAAQQMYQHVTGTARNGGAEWQWVQAFRYRVQSIRDKQIAEAIRPRIEAAMTEQVQRTDSHGHACGEPQTVGELVLQEARNWMEKEVGTYDRRQTQMAKVISEQVNRTLTSEFQDAIAKGKAQIKKVLEAEAAKVLAETILRQAKA